MSKHESPEDDAAADRRRRALLAALEAAEMTPTDAARAAGWDTPNRLYNFLRGRSRSLSQDTIDALCRVIPNVSAASLTGIEPPAEPALVVRPLQVRAIAQAGYLQPAFDLPPAKQAQIAVTLRDDMHARGAYGIEVKAPGAEKLYPEGTILVCLPVASWDGDITTGMRLILQRIRGDRVEVTVREIEIEANEAWLWQRSSHPEHQAPIQLPWIPNQPPKAWRTGDDRFAIVAVVVLAVVPQV